MDYNFAIGIAEILSFLGVGGGFYAFYTAKVSKKQLEANVFATLQASYETLIKTLQERTDRHADLIEKLEAEKQKLRENVCFDKVCNKRKIY
jgi:prefoldin subunit 5